MKIRIYLTIVLAGFSLLASCSYLDQVPEDELTLEMVFNDTRASPIPIGTI